MMQRFWNSYALAMLIPVIVILCWQFGVAWFHVPAYILPAPDRILHALIDKWSIFPRHIGMTLLEMAIGIIFSVGLGILFAMMIHFSGFAARTIYPVLIASQAIPLMTISPVLNVWFGYSIWSKVTVVVIWTFFPVTVTLVQGLRAVDPEQLDVLRTMRASRWQLFRLVEWPAALPGLFGGLKMAVLFSVVGATVGEWLGAEYGLGVLTRRASGSMQTDLLFAGSLVLMVIGLILFLLVKWWEYHVLFWTRPNPMEITDLRREK